MPRSTLVARSAARCSRSPRRSPSRRVCSRCSPSCRGCRRCPSSRSPRGWAPSRGACCAPRGAARDRRPRVRRRRRPRPRGRPASPVLTPVAVEVSAELGARLGPPDPKARGAFMSEVVPRVRERLFAELGLALPTVRLRADAPGLEGGAFVVRLNEVPLARGTIAREDWPGRGRAPRRRGARAAAPLRPRAARRAGDAGAARPPRAHAPRARARGRAQAVETGLWGGSGRGDAVTERSVSAIDAARLAA